MGSQGCGSHCRNSACDPAYYLTYPSTPPSALGSSNYWHKITAYHPRENFLVGSGMGGGREKATMYTHVTITQKHPNTHRNDLFAFCTECGEPCFLLSFKLELGFPMLTIMLHYCKCSYVINLNNTHTLCHASEWKTITKEAKAEPLWKP